PAGPRSAASKPPGFPRPDRLSTGLPEALLCILATRPPSAVSGLGAWANPLPYEGLRGAHGRHLHEPSREVLEVRAEAMAACPLPQRLTEYLRAAEVELRQLVQEEHAMPC